MTTHHPKRGAWYGLVTLCMAASCASVTPYAACLLHDQDTVTAAHKCVADVCHHVQADYCALSVPNVANIPVHSRLQTAAASWHCNRQIVGICNVAS